MTLIALFGKHKLRITIRGNSFNTIIQCDGNIDIFKTVTLAIIAKIVGVEESFECTVFKRDLVDGRASLVIPFVKHIDPFDYSKTSFIKAIKGLVIS